MATTGLLDKIPLVEGGAKGVVLSADALNALIMRINLLSSPSLNPTANAGGFYVSKAGVLLDVSPIMQQIANLQARMDSATINGICNGSNIEITLNI